MNNGTATQTESFIPVWTDTAVQMANDVINQHDRKVQVAKRIRKTALNLESLVQELNELTRGY